MRIGLLGAGRIGAFHGAVLSRHPDVDELVVGDADPGRATALAERLDATAVADVGAVLGAGLDGVVIATATAAHAELVVRAADKGVPTFCEKPIALDVEGTVAVLARTAAAGVPLHVGFQRRFDRDYLAARDSIESGRLGDLYAIRMVGSDKEPPPADYVPTSGGIFRDLHIHDFDALRFVTGREVVEVFAWGANRGAEFFSRHGDSDVTAVVLRLDDHTLATLGGARQNPAGYDIRMELSGSGGTLAVGLDDRTPLRPARSDVDWPAGAPYDGFLDRFADAYAAELSAFLDLARGRIPSPCSGSDALEALYVAEAAQRSADEGRPVRVDEVRVDEVRA
jgi:myo-inositol 2-dehydrogenase/D-chiro-inositol 1-dehydrogenase